MTDKSPESELIRTVATRDAYDRYRPFLKDYVTVPEACVVIEDIGEWFKANPSSPELDWSQFLAWSRVAQHSVWKPDKWLVYETIVKTAQAVPAANPAIVERFRELDAASQIASKADAALANAGTGSLDEIGPILDAFTKGSKDELPSLVSSDISQLLDEVIHTGGVEWRLEDLNRSVGNIRRGDLIVVGARPEVGKTTLLCSEATYMVPQLPEGQHGLIVNNEERGQKVALRLVQSALNISLQDIVNDPSDAQAKYKAVMGGRRIDVVSRPTLSVTDVEKLCRKGEYGFIGINVLDKLWGFPKLEGVERSSQLAIWARELADRYGIVFAMYQADASAEGQRNLDQSQLYGSKTKVQGEGDVIIMVGKEHNPGQGEVRWLNLCKNKMPFGPRVQPNLSHAQFEVKIDGARGRYLTVAYKGARP